LLFDFLRDKIEFNISFERKDEIFENFGKFTRSQFVLFCFVFVFYNTSLSRLNKNNSEQYLQWNYMKIIAVNVFQLKQLKRRNLKKFRLERESNP